MSTQILNQTTALVTGAGRGFGRGIATALTVAGATVVGVARTDSQLQELRAELGERFIAVAADAAAPATARELIERHRPTVLVLNAGAVPVMGPLTEQTWESFGRNWEVDTQHVFHWTREALRQPLSAGSLVVAISSGAALRGSPLSGGYAGAKAATRFISSYAAEQSRRETLGIRFVSLLPQLTPVTDLGSVGVSAYAASEGIDVDTFVEHLQPILTPERMGSAVVELVAISEPSAAYLVTGSGLQSLA